MKIIVRRTALAVCTLVLAVILCERGIRTFETDSRATLDVAGIAALKEQSHLPVLADPSHAGPAGSVFCKP